MQNNNVRGLAAIRNGTHPGLRRFDWPMIADELGIANGPYHIVYKILCSDLGYRDRGFMAAFGFVNGIPSDRINFILRRFNIEWTPLKGRKIWDLYRYWGWDAVQAWDRDDNPWGEFYQRRCRYYGYDVRLGRVVDLNHHIRHVNVPGRDDDAAVVPPGVVPGIGDRPGNGFVPVVNRGDVYGRYRC